VPACRGDFDGAFDMLLTLDLPEIQVLFNGTDVGPTVERAHRLQGDISAQKMHNLRKRRASVDIDTLDHGGFRGILMRHDESLTAASFGFQGDQQDSFHRTQLLALSGAQRTAWSGLAET
jgi:hypothetical protein